MTDIAWVTCGEHANLIDTEQRVVDKLRTSGISVSPVVWDDQSVEWENFSLVIIRTAWDYHLKIDQFLVWLEMLESYNINILNSPDIIRWNHHKFYLRDLESKGIDIVESSFVRKNELSVEDILDQTTDRELIVKPAISATAYGLTRIDPRSPDIQSLMKLEKLSRHNDVIIQDYRSEIANGEWSLMFFDNEYSHAVIKKPKNGDFRVQNNFGGISEMAEPGGKVLDQVREILIKIDLDLLYARVDGLVVKGKFILMELELIEPELFLLTDTIRENFIKAIKKRI